jgi:hypothetical protein
MTVFLPLSKFSAKILATEYGGQSPITPGRADWLSDILRINRSDTRFTPEEEAIIQSGLMIQVPPPVAQLVEAQSLRIGIVIHRLHLENLSRHMAACAIRCPGKGHATAAMRDYYQMYGLDDDDFSPESAYREYSRFSKKFLSKPATNIAADVRPKSRVWQQADTSVQRINHEQLDRICAYLDERFAEARIRRVQILSQHAHMYIYAVRGGRDVAAIARRFKRHRANVYRALAHIRHRLKNDERVAKAMRPLLNPSFVLPPPD